MPSNKYNFKLTDEMKNQLRLDVAGLKTAGMFAKGTPTSAKTIMEIAKQNEPSGMHFLTCCYIGPTHMSEILVSSGIKVDKMSLADQVYYAIAMEKMFGLSTKFKYDKENNQFIPEREAEAGKQYGDVFTFNEEDLELGVWDKICAFFGYTTDHAERVNFIKESLAEQEKALNGLNKDLVAGKRKEYLENNKDLYEKNKEVLQQAKDLEAVWNKEFFGENKVADYKFDNGKKISALSACIAMYKNEYGENICDKKPGEIDEGTKEKMAAVADKYLKLQKMKDGAKIDAFNISVTDIHMTNAISYKDGFEVDYDKNVPNLNELKNTKLKNQARMVNNYVILKMKAEMNNLFKGEKEYERNAQEKALTKVSIDVKMETKIYEDIRDRKYENIAKHIETLDGNRKLGIDTSYQMLIETAGYYNAVSKNELNDDINKNRDLLSQIENNNPELENDDGLSKN